jgi:NAD(P)H-hydrate epimerase
MTGAAILAGRGAIRSGTGLLTLKVPAECLSIVQTALPEATAIPWTTTCWDRQDELSKWTAIGIGPGLSRNEQLVPGFQCLLEQQPARLVIDADGINLLSEHRFLIERLPRQAILTPHPGEFDRLTASSSTSALKAGIRISGFRPSGLYNPERSL